MRDLIDMAKWLWHELHRKDLGDAEHYPNGFRKFSCFSTVQYIRLALSVLSLIMACLALLSTR